MGFLINNELWQPQTTNEHAEQWMENINRILEENNIRDEEGNIIKMSRNFANALYLQVLAGANRLADNDQNLQKAINSFNIELCDDQQIENLLPIAAITRNPGSYSTLVLTVTASDTDDCTIPAGTRAPYGDVNFVVQTEAVVQAGTSQNIETVCDTVGAVTVLTGEITSFEQQIPNLESVINNVSSIPGNAAETTNELRRRLIRGQTISYSLDGVKFAIEGLTGVNNARVYFNYNNTENIELPGGIIVAPRFAYIVINGSSDEIASVYCKYMNAPTQNAPGASPTGTETTVACSVTATAEGTTIPEGTTFVYDGMTFESDAEVVIAANATETVNFTAIDVGPVVIPAGAITEFSEPIEGVDSITNSASVPGDAKTAYSQDYTTASGQTIPIKYDKALNTQVFVKVMIEKGATFGSQIVNQVKRDLIASSAVWQIGETITSLITGSPFEDCTYTTVAYTQVSLDGTTWSNRVVLPANSIPRISDSTIVVEAIE